VGTAQPPGRARSTPGMGLCWRQLPVAPARCRRRALPRCNADEAAFPAGAGMAAGGWQCLGALLGGHRRQRCLGTLPSLPRR